MNTQHDAHVVTRNETIDRANRAVQCVANQIDGAVVHHHGGVWWEMDVKRGHRIQFNLDDIWNWVVDLTGDGWFDLYYYILGRYEAV